MPPRIAAIVTTPPGFNPGMVATELALVAFLRRHGWLAQTEFFQVMPWSERLAHLPAHERASLLARGDAGIAYRAGARHEGAIARSEVVLLWADFLHMADHVRQMQAVVDAHLAARGEPPDRTLVSRLFLLAEADDATLRRTISFGTSLLFNTLGDELDAAYAQPLTRLMALARRVWVRDALSAARVAHLRGDYRSGYFGVDCALLLRPEDVRRELAARGGRGELLALAAALGARSGRPLRWLPWGDRGAFPALGAATAPALSPDLTALELLSEVMHASLVVTDTYHLAATAWSFGVPAVAAFAGHTAAPQVDVSSGAAFNWRDKREVFFSQYDALDFLVRPEELADLVALGRRTERIIAALGDAPLRAAITARMRAHAASAEADLAAEIAALLARQFSRYTS